MKDQNGKGRPEPEVIVEYIPGRRKGTDRNNGGNRSGYYYYQRHVHIRPVSPWRLILWGAAGLALICFLVAVGSTILLLAAAAGAVCALWRRLAGAR